MFQEKWFVLKHKKKTTIIKFDSNYQNNTLFQILYKDKVYKKK